jgi:hypothetical protein
VAIRKAESRRQKHDRRDAALLLQLLAEDRFPTIWMPSTELGDVRALLLHRRVRMRKRVQNALHAIAMAHGKPLRPLAESVRDAREEAFPLHFSSLQRKARIDVSRERPRV